MRMIIELSLPPPSLHILVIVFFPNPAFNFHTYTPPHPSLPPSHSLFFPLPPSLPPSRADLDPIYYCELLKLCPIKDDGDAHILSLLIKPKDVEYGMEI